MDLSRGDWTAFDAVTPGGHRIEGWACQDRDENLGRLEILRVDGLAEPQTVMSMPKLKYPISDYSTHEVALPEGRVFVSQKHDGSCLTAYPLYLGGVAVETCFKTRSLPLASLSTAWIDGDDLAGFILRDQPGVDAAVRETGLSLSFEVYGTGNPHLVDYSAEPEPLLARLLLAIDPTGRVLAHAETADLAERYMLRPVEHQFSASCLSAGLLEPTAWFDGRFGDLAGKDSLRADAAGMGDAALYAWLQSAYGRINSAGRAGTGRKRHYLVEGSVLRVEGPAGVSFWKCKDPDVEEYHVLLGTLESSRGDELVTKAVSKARENLTLRELADPETARDYVLGELGEELPQGTLDKVLPRVSRRLSGPVRIARLTLEVEASGLELSGDPAAVMPGLLDSHLGRDLRPGQRDGQLYQAWQGALRLRGN